MADPSTHDEELDALFALPPDEFVEARDRLAKELKAAGDGEAAAAVKKLRRPTVAAAAVNRLAREARSELDELLAVGDRLREAYETLLHGGGDSGVREATAAKRKLVGTLTKRALGFGTGGEAQREAIADTLEAAVADSDAAEAVRGGRLTKELVAPSTFGGALVFGSEDGSERGAGADAGSRTRHIEGEEAEGEAGDEAAAESLRRAERLERLQREADRTAAVAEDAAQRVAEARAEVGRLEALLESALEEVRSAVDDERAARAAADRAARDAKGARIS